MESKQPNSWLTVALLVVGLVAVAVLYFVLQGSESPVASDVFVIPYTEEDDVTSADRTWNVDGLDVTVSMSRPAKIMKPVLFTITVAEDGAPVAVADPVLAFNMKMDMGRFVYKPMEDGDTLIATATLPACMSGGKRWYGRLRFDHGGTTHEKVFLLDLQ